MLTRVARPLKGDVIDKIRADEDSAICGNQPEFLVNILD